MVLDLHRVAFRPPLSARDGQLPELFFFLRIDADNRLTGSLVVLDLLVDIAELSIPVRVLRTLQCLARPLQA